MTLAALFPALPAEVAWPLTVAACLACVGWNHRVHGPAMTAYYLVATALFLLPAVAWVLVEPTRWPAWNEAVCRSTLGTVLAVSALMMLRLPPRQWKGGRLYAAGGLFLLGMLHGMSGWIMGAGWVSALVALLGSTVASVAAFLLLQRWPRWRDWHENYVMNRISASIQNQLAVASEDQQ